MRNLIINLKSKINRLAKSKKLHSNVQSKLKRIIRKAFPNSTNLSELSRNSYNYDFYSIVEGVKLHIEIIYSVGVVDRDINMLKSSDADLRIALIKDDFLDKGKVYKKFWNEMESRDIPLENFVRYNLSLLFGKSGIKDFTKDLKRKIDNEIKIKDTSKFYDEIKLMIENVGRSEDINLFSEFLQEKSILKKDFNGKNIVRSFKKIQNKIKKLTIKPDINAEELCRFKNILDKYRTTILNKKILSLNIKESIDINHLITFFESKWKSNEKLKDTDFKELLDLKYILDTITVFTNSDLIFLLNYKKFSPAIFDNYAQNIANEPFNLLSNFGLKKFVEHSWEDEYSYENICRILRFFKCIIEYKEMLLNNRVPQLTYPTGDFLKNHKGWKISANKYYDIKTRIFASASVNFRQFDKKRDNKVYMWNLSHPNIPEVIFSGSNLSLTEILIRTIGGTTYLLASSEDNCIYVWDIRFYERPIKIFLTKTDSYVKLITLISVGKKLLIVGKSGKHIYFWNFYGSAYPVKEIIIEDIFSNSCDFKSLGNKLLYCGKQNFTVYFGDILKQEAKNFEIVTSIDENSIKWAGINALKIAFYKGNILLLAGGQFKEVYTIDTSKMKLMDKFFEQKDEKDVVTDLLLEKINGKFSLIASTLKHKILIWDFENDEKYPDVVSCGDDDLYKIEYKSINGKDYIFAIGINNCVYMVDVQQKKVVETFIGSRGHLNSLSITKIPQHN